MLNQLPDGHPLKEKKLSYIGSREEWKKRWDETSNLEELIGLLHFGLDVPGSGRYGEWAELVIFYLDLAHGYQDQNKWIDSEERNGMCCHWKTSVNPGPDDPSSARQQVAKKAWKMLCTKILGPLVAKPLTDTATARRWLGYLEHDNLVMAFVKFFSCGDNIPRLYSGLDRDIDITRDFLKIFVTIGWDYGYIAYRADGSNISPKLDRFSKHQTELLKIIARLGLWDEVFLDDQQRWASLSEADLEGIDGLIKEHWLNYHVTRDEPYSLEAAAFQGWKAPRFLLMVRLLKKEQARQNELQEAKQQKREAERRLKEISARK